MARHRQSLVSGTGAFGKAHLGMRRFAAHNAVEHWLPTSSFVCKSCQLTSFAHLAAVSLRIDLKSLTDQ
jgi:hypothetical protein